jgi:hypothetical protein
VSSIKPNDRGEEMNCGEKVSGGFVVAGCDGAELLEFSEEVLDEVPRFVGISVELPWLLSVRPGRDHHGFAGRRQRLDDASVSVERFVGDEHVGFHGRQKVISADQIMGLPTGQEEADRVAECIDQSVDFGAQPAP